MIVSINAGVGWVRSSSAFRFLWRVGGGVVAVRVRVQLREAVKVTLARVDLALVRKSRDWQSRVCFPPRPKTHGGRSAVEVSSGAANYRSLHPFARFGSVCASL